MIINVKMEKSDLTLSTYVQYVEEEDFKVRLMLWENIIGFWKKKSQNVTLVG